MQEWDGAGSSGGGVDDDVDIDMPPLLNEKRQRGGRRGRNRNRDGGSNSNTPHSLAAHTPNGVLPSPINCSHQLFVSKVPFKWTSRELHRVLNENLPQMTGCIACILSITPFRGRRFGASPSTTPTLSSPSDCSLYYSALVEYSGLALTGTLPKTISTTGFGCIAIDISTSTQIPPKLEPVATLYGKAYVFDKQLPSSIAVHHLLSCMHKYNPGSVQGISLMSTVGRQLRMDGWYLTQFMIECDTIGYAQLIREELDEVILSSGNHMMLLSVEYTSEKKNEVQHSKPKHLFVRREQQGASQWCSETIEAREKNRKQIEAIKNSITMDDLRQETFQQPSLPKKLVVGSFPAMPPPVSAFPCNPDDGSGDDFSLSPQDISDANAGKELIIAESCSSSDRSRNNWPPKPDTDITRLIQNCLSTVSEKFQVPSTHNKAVLMGAAAFAILSGHYPNDEGEDMQTVWSRLINQLDISYGLFVFPLFINYYNHTNQIAL